MATIQQLMQALRNADAAGDTVAAAQFAAIIRRAQKAGTAQPQPQPAGQQVTEDQLRHDPDWIAASRTIYDMDNGRQPDAGTSDEDVANYGLDSIGWFNNNLPVMAKDAARLTYATPEQKKAFLYLMDRSDNLAWSWEGAGRLFKGMAADPSTYVGAAFAIPSGGLDEAAISGGALATKAGIKAMLHAGINAGVRGAVDGFVYGSARDALHQSVAVQGGEQPGFDVDQMVRAGGENAAAGFVLGGVVGAGAKAVQAKLAGRAVEDAADAAEPTPQPGAGATGGDETVGNAPAAEAPMSEAPAPQPPANDNPPSGAVVRGVNVVDGPELPEGAAEAVMDAPAGGTVDMPTAAPAESPEAPAVSPESIPTQTGEAPPATPVEQPSAIPNSVPLDAELPEGVKPANDLPANGNASGLVGPAKGIVDHLNNILDAVRSLATNGPVRVVDGVQSMARLNAATKGISDMIVHASQSGDAGGLADALLRSNVTAAQMQVLKNAAQQANDSLLRNIVRVTKDARATTDSALGNTLRAQADQLEATRAAVQNLDVELSTQSGRDLRMRQEGLNAGEVRGLSLKGLMEEGGMSRQDAEATLTGVVAQREAAVQNQAELRNIAQQMSVAQRQQDFTAMQRLRQQRDTVLGRTDAQVTTGGAKAGPVYRAFNKAVGVVTEVVISNVFSPATLITNTVPSYAAILVKPFLNYLAKGILSPHAFQEMLAGYTALHSMNGAALRTALLAFKYERAILMHDAGTPFFGHGVIPKRFGGGILRFFPRALMAQDEFMSQIAYRSYAVGQATANALADADTKGLTGAAKNAFVKQAVKDATERLYSASPEGDEGVVNMLLDEAQDRGLGGEKANAWVRDQLNRNAQYLRQAQNEAGKDYVKDLLFKREFSGEGTGPAGTASRLAKAYEQFVRDNPLMKVVGQLFFRTPIRVFEEGLRLTPGLNLITPRFMADLAGKNGAARQVRAQGESLLGYSLFGAVLSLYGNGTITGGGPQDFRQEREGEDSDGWQPYSIKLPNGTWWSYRNLDPIATPLKIIVNALDRWQVLDYRASQGEAVDQSETDKAVAYMGAGVGAVAQAISDANLTQGFDNAWKFFQSLDDPRAGNQSDQFVKALGGFLADAIPATWSKTRMIVGAPAFLNDPVTLEQILRAKINPQDRLVPRQYTATGRPRTLTAPGAGLFVFDPIDSRQRGVSAEEREVDRDLFALGQAANTDFTAPYKSPLLPQIDDLRKLVTRDGKETYYDRWQRYVHASNVVDVLHSVLTSGLPYGAPGNSPAAREVNKMLNAYREAAMVRLIREEVGNFSGLTDDKVRQFLQSRVSNGNVPFR